MARSNKTILKLVQKIGQAIGSDEIDALSETIEVDDITSILEDTYEEIINRKDWEFLKGRVLQMDERLAGDTQLNRLTIPADVTRVSCIRYRDDNTDRESYKDLTYLPACDFVAQMQGRNPNEDNVTTIINDDGVSLFVYTDKAPQYWTSFDESRIEFDAYDVARGSGVQVADTVIIADIVPVVDFTDPTAVLPIPLRMEQLILNEAISTAAVRLRQTADPRADRLARRQNIALKEHEPTTRKDTLEANYGRRTRSGR
jgi:hypothetical protein